MAAKKPWTFLGILSLAVLMVGAVLVGFMIYTEDEPGALPLAMVLAGALGTAATWRKRGGA